MSDKASQKREEASRGAADKAEGGSGSTKGKEARGSAPPSAGAASASTATSTTTSKSSSKVKLPDFSKFDQLVSKQRKSSSSSAWPERYRALKVLGKGHDGTTYLCEDRNYADLVAVKVLNPKRTRPITEPDIMKELDHPNIVRLRKHFLIEKQNFMVMEYAGGGDLCDYVYEHERLDEDTARRFTAQLVEAVSHMHDRGICHRDLKLDNIFLDKSLNIKVGDFGASTHFDQETKLTYRCGTTQYNAPELVKNQGYFGDEVDCWAIGVILYVMLLCNKNV